MKYSAPILSVLSILFLSTVAMGCVCDSTPDVRKAYKESAAVFAGTYVGGEFRKGIKNEGTEMHLETMGKKEDYEILVLKFEVSNWYKGQDNGNTTAELVTDLARLPDGTQIVSDCEFVFEKGKSYLVYAYEDANKNIGTGACTRTKGLKSAGIEIRTLKQLAPKESLGQAISNPFLSGISSQPFPAAALAGGR